MIRKLLLSVLCCTTLATVQVSAKGKLPKVHAGVKLGANFDQLTGSSWSQSYKPGIVGGAFGQVTYGNFGIQAEVLANTAQYDFKDSFKTGTFRAVYINVPVLLEYRVVPRIWVQAGPQFGNLVSMKSDNSTIADPKSYFNSSTVSGVLGVQATLPVHLVAGVRYIMGFTDVRNVSSTTEAWKNRTIQLYLGFRFV